MKARKRSDVRLEVTKSMLTMYCDEGALDHIRSASYINAIHLKAGFAEILVDPRYVCVWQDITERLTIEGLSVQVVCPDEQVDRVFFVPSSLHKYYMTS